MKISHLVRHKLLEYMQKSCSDTFISCYTRNGNIKAKLKTSQKWVTVTSPDDLFTELMLIINRWTVENYLTTNSTTKILPSVNSETKRSMQATTYTWTTNCQKQNAYVSALILYVRMLFQFWIHGCWRSSTTCVSHLNLDESLYIFLAEKYVLLSC